MEVGRETCKPKARNANLYLENPSRIDTREKKYKKVLLIFISIMFELIAQFKYIIITDIFFNKNGYAEQKRSKILLVA